MDYLDRRVQLHELLKSEEETEKGGQRDEAEEAAEEIISMSRN